MTARDACGILGIPTNHTLKDLKTAFRKSAATHHPDLGGDPNLFNVMREAYALLLPEAQQRDSVCPHCNGEGKIWVKCGFSSLSQICLYCENGQKPKENR